MKPLSNGFVRFTVSVGLLALVALPQQAIAQEAVVERLQGRLGLATGDTSAPQVSLEGAVPFTVRFDSDVRGLTVGAPVEIRGIPIGAVQRIDLRYDAAGNSFAVLVALLVQPKGFPAAGDPPSTAEQTYDAVETLVKRGLRARLASPKLLGDGLVIELVLLPDPPDGSLDRSADPPRMPVAPSRAEELQAKVRQAIGRLASLPLDQVFERAEESLTALQALVQGPELKEALANLRDGTASLKALADSMDGRLDAIAGGVDKIVARAGRTFDKAGETLDSIQRSVGDRSPVLADVRRLLRELDGAARSLRLMADYLERHPDALIRGKKDIRQ
ncbi:MAG: hypothetical protein Kilf2KO_00710 [Rhodospirillales bacterium]